MTQPAVSLEISFFCIEKNYVFVRKYCILWFQHGRFVSSTFMLGTKRNHHSMIKELAGKKIVSRVSWREKMITQIN